MTINDPADALAKVERTMDTALYIWSVQAGHKHSWAGMFRRNPFVARAVPSEMTLRGALATRRACIANGRPIPEKDKTPAQRLSEAVFADW